MIGKRNGTYVVDGCLPFAFLADFLVPSDKGEERCDFPTLCPTHCDILYQADAVHIHAKLS